MKKLTKRLLALTVALGMLIGIMPMAVHAVDLISDGSGGFLVDMPDKGSYTLDLSDKSAGFSFHVYDNGGDDAQYSNNCNCYLAISAPAGCVISVSGTLKTESGSYDYLKFYDGDDRSSYIGQEKYYGTNLSISNIISSDNVLEIYFKSDSTNQQDGFDLLVEILDASSVCTLTYSGRDATKTDTYKKGTAVTVKAYTDLFGSLPFKTNFLKWSKDSGGDCAAGDTLTLNNNTVLTAVLEDLPILETGSEGYFALVPPTGEVTLDLTDKSAGFSFRLYDEGGKDGNYSASCSGSLTVLAPANCIISVSGTIKTEGGNYDYLTFYDGADTSTYINQEKYYGTNLTVSDIMSTADAMRIYFKSDYSVQHEGFDLTVTLASASSLCTLSYSAGEGSGTMASIAVLSGTAVILPECDFTLPAGKWFDHYTDGANHYQPGDSVTVNADMTLTAVYIETVTLTYSGFHSSPKTETYKKGAAVTVKDYTAAIGAVPYRKTFTGWSVSTGGDCAAGDALTLNNDTVLTAVFFSEPMLEESEDGYFAVMPVTGTGEIDLTDKSAGFSFTLYDDGGKTGNYSNKCDGELYIIAPEGYSLSYSRSGVSERYDRIYIYDSETSKGTYNSAADGEAFTVPETVTDTNILKVRFYSDSTENYAGFELTVTVVSPASVRRLSFAAGEGTGTMSNIAVPAGTTVTIPESGFTAPEGKMFVYYSDGANRYDPGDSITLNGNTTLTAIYAEKVTVTLSCDESNKTVYMPMGVETVLPEFASLFTPPDRYRLAYWHCADGNNYSDGGAYTANSAVTFEAVLEREPDILPDGAGGWYAKVPVSGTVSVDLTDKSAGFSFHVYDNGGKSSQYAKSCNGYLTVLAPAGCIISVSGTIKTESRHYDYLTFYDGADNTSAYINQEEYFGENLSVSDIFSSGNVMTIYFNSDTSLQKDGFDLLVEFIDESSLCTLSYSAGEGSGTMAGVTRLAGSTVTVAACGFTAPEYTAFDHYTDGINNYDVGDTVTLSDDITLTAVYVPTATVVYLYDGKEETSIVKVGTVITLEDFDEMFYAPPRHSFICWRDEADGAEYDAGDSFTVNATAVFDAVVEETEPFFISDGAGGWYAKMPDSGDDYVDLSDKAPGFSFTLYDDGGPDGNYSDRCDGYLNLTAPYGCVFSISGNVATEATFDYVKVYDGENLAGILYGTETVDVYETSGEALRIDFHSDSKTNYEGFALTVTVVMHPVETGINYNYQTTYSETVMTGDTITLATFRNAFERFGRYAPEGKRFAGWRDTRTGLIYAEGASYFVGGFTEFEPVFEDTTPWAAMNTSLAAMGGSVTVSLTEDLVASAGDTPIVFPVDALVTLDLAGYSIDGTLAADEDGSIMIVNGGLTIVDSVGGGEIEGGNITAYSGAPVSIDAAADRFDATLTQKYGIYSTVSGIWNYYPYAVSYCPTFADAIHYAANVEYDYKDSLSRIPENDDYFEYEEPVVTLLNNVTIPAGTSVGELTYDVIYIDLNGKSLNNLGTLTGVDGYDRTTFVIESEVPGTFRSSGNIAADLTFWNGDTAYITGGTISGYFYAYGGTHHITGGVFTAETMFSNGNPEAALNAYISGNARFDAGLEYYVDSNSDYIEPNMVINGNVLVNGMDFSISYVNPDDCSFMGDVLTVNNGYFADDPHDFYPGNSYDDAINISGTIEEYGSQTDWAADPSVYLWRVVTLPNLTYSFKSGGSLIANIENAPASSVLVAARYDAFGKVTDLQKVSDPGDTHTFTMAGSGSCYRLFLFDSLDTLMPLCEAWEN